MRDIVLWIAFIAIVVSLYFFGVLQDRAYRKVGGRRLSFVTMWRVFQTKELLLAALLMLSMIIIVHGFFALDEMDFFGPRPLR